MLGNRRFFKIKKDSGQICDFASVHEELYNEDNFAETDNFEWIEYFEQREEYEVENVEKIRWNLIINDVKIGELDDMKIGCIYNKVSNIMYPKIDFGTMSPALFVFDMNENEWKAPIIEGGTVKVWNTSLKQYKPVA